MMPRDPLGAALQENGRCRFTVWAPHAEGVEVLRTDFEAQPAPMVRQPEGYFGAELAAPPGARYRYRLHRPDGEVRDRPDPASRSQPEGVHGPSQVVSTVFDWFTQNWCGRPLTQYVIYELHVGTFSREGTFDGAVRHLDALAELGVTAVELMPVAQFPGDRNWGYDGVYPFAVQNSYGGAEGLKRLVDACHRRGLAVVLDVVYNHLGPEGNYLRDFGPYFTDFYRTPWGEALNFDGPHSDHVRHYFIANALQWVDEFRIDALRLDAVHAILDFSARPFLEELGRAVHQRAEALNRRIHLIAESALNDTRIVRPRELGGFALDAQWNDDFHHSLRTALGQEGTGYYRDYKGLEDLARAWREGYVYTGQYSAFRQRAHGNASRLVPARQFVVFAQNHDQVGNRMRGERLSTLVSFEQQKLAAAVVLLSPFIPLLFMGEEYGATTPFLYFVSHGDPDLVAAVREGRQREFAAFEWRGEPPDPQDEATFRKSVLDHASQADGSGQCLYNYCQTLLALRRERAELANLSKKAMTVDCDHNRGLLMVRRTLGSAAALLIFNFNGGPEPALIDLPEGHWCLVIDSADERWNGPGANPPAEEIEGPSVVAAAPHSAVVFTCDQGPASQSQSA
jgi:maltooligosyltrehalose trehalohydrolase